MPFNFESAELFKEGCPHLFRDEFIVIAFSDFAPNHKIGGVSLILLSEVLVKSFQQGLIRDGAWMVLFHLLGSILHLVASFDLLEVNLVLPLPPPLKTD
jgi:hypothetical protein